MKKVIVSGTMAMLIGLLLAVPLSAQTTGPMANKPVTQLQDIRMLVLVDRMNLSPDQMQTLHDALTTIIDQASDLQTPAASFQQDLINFHGTNDQLNALLDQYREKLHDATANMRDKAKTALDSLKTSLTIEQGELLRQALMPAAPRMGMNNAPVQPRSFGTRPMGRFGSSPWGEKGESLRPMRPQAGFVSAHPMLDRGKEFLMRANTLVKILELKLKALGS